MSSGTIAFIGPGPSCSRRGCEARNAHPTGDDRQRYERAPRRMRSRPWGVGLEATPTGQSLLSVSDRRSIPERAVEPWCLHSAARIRNDPSMDEPHDDGRRPSRAARARSAYDHIVGTELEIVPDVGLRDRSAIVAKTFDFHGLHRHLTVGSPDDGILRSGQEAARSARPPGTKSTSSARHRRRYGSAGRPRASSKGPPSGARR